MSFFNHIYLLERVHQFIKNKATGKPKDFALRLNISERTLYRVLEELKDRGAIIAYNQERSTYYYLNTVELKFSFQILSDETGVIKGGLKQDFDSTANNCSIGILVLESERENQRLGLELNL